MVTTTISLPDDQFARLRVVALLSGRSLDEVVREAVDAYLASLPETPTPRVTEPPDAIPSNEWNVRFDAVTERIRQAGPIDLTPEEIEREITLASEEARQERIAQKRAIPSSEVVGTHLGMLDPTRNAQIDAALARLRARIPTDLTAEEIGAEIDAAWEEVRRERRVSRH